MSSKYSEKNVLQIKRDIQKASEELALINQQKEEALKGRNGLEALRLMMALERKAHNDKVANIWIQAGNDLKLIQETKRVLNEEVNALRETKAILEYQVSTLSLLLTATIKKIQEQKDNLTFIPSLVEKTKEILAVLSHKKTKEQHMIGKMEAEKNLLENGLENLKKFEADYKKKIADLENIIVENTEKINSLIKERNVLQDTVDEINRREHDSAILIERLKKEYREEVVNRKK